MKKQNGERAVAREGALWRAQGRADQRSLRRYLATAPRLAVSNGHQSGGNRYGRPVRNSRKWPAAKSDYEPQRPTAALHLRLWKQASYLAFCSTDMEPTDPVTWRELQASGLRVRQPQSLCMSRKSALLSLSALC